jgi:uncharacterized membrane protein YkoI
MTKTATRFAIFFAALGVALGGARAGEGGCIGDWSVAAPIVKQEGLVTIEHLSARATSNFGGAIVKAMLCGEKGSYAYRLVVRTPGGKLKTVTVNARTPFSSARIAP